MGRDVSLFIAVDVQITQATYYKPANWGSIQGVGGYSLFITTLRQDLKFTQPPLFRHIHPGVNCIS
jgi:hypothetical protein